MAGAKCIVLGGGGFIGTHLCGHLHRQGYIVRSFGRQAASVKGRGIEWLTGDFNDETALASALDGFEIVVHLIHATTPSSANAEKVADIQRSVVGTVKLLDACVALGVKKVIFVSSGGTVYGSGYSGALSEDHPTLPISAYGVNKLTIENYLRVYHYLDGLDYRVLRLSNPFGPLQTGSKNQGLIPNATRQIIREEAITIYGDGSNIRDYVYIDDLLDCFCKIMTYSGEHRVFNVGAGEGKSIMQIIAAAAARVGKKPRLNHLPARPFDVAANVLSIDRAREELSWSPTTSFDDGMDKTIAWLLENYK